MTIRLNKVTKDLNVGISTVVDFLQKRGHAIKPDLNTKITEEEYDMLVKEFSTDKNLRIESNRFIQQRQNKERNKSVSINDFDVDVKSEEQEEEDETDVIETVIPKEARPHVKPVGKIDLNNLGSGFVPEQKLVNSVIKEEETPEISEIRVEAEETVVQENVARVEDKKEEAVVVDETSVKIAAEKPELVKVVEELKEKPELEKDVKEEVLPKQQAIILKENKEPIKEVKPQKEQEKLMKETDNAHKLKEDVNIKSPEKEQLDLSKEEREEVKVEDKSEEPVKRDNTIFVIHEKKEKPKINIVGQIDLSTLNQSTRPKKKTKEEKRKEREEKEKIRQDQKKQMREAIIKEIRKDDQKVARPNGNNNGNNNNNKSNNSNNNNNNVVSAKKKRNRISNEKVDINKVSLFNHGPNDKNGTHANTPHNQDGARRNRDRYRKPLQKQEVKEEDVAKQIKETLARLTNKGKTKTSKYRKEKREQASNRQQELEQEERKESKIIKLTEFVTANELATMMDVSVNQVISTCMSVGMMVSINQRLDAETINVVTEEFGYKTEFISAEVAQAVVEEKDKEEDLVSRPPIVTVMGHVDHGKTSLLDYIRKANVIAGEAGGITQHIGAYNVKLEDGRRITFLDTPGHEAFTAMRARGARVTDVAIIIVAADDHVMPQTREAINHAVAANVPIVFAINKIDKPGASADKVKEELAGMNFLVEEWGGKYQSQDISAKQGIGVKELMEKVLLEADVLELKANPKRKAAGSIIESSLDKGRGYVATVLVSNGTLKIGDIVLAGTSFGRVKAMFNERNLRIKQAGPSEPALILGLNGAPQAGDIFHVMDTEQEARELTNKREQLQREQGIRTQKTLTLDELGRRIALGDFKELNVIIKGDVDGSIEALKDSLIKLSTERIQVNVIHAAVGQISESDVSLAAASDAIIIGFQVRPSAAARKQAEQDGVDIRLYSVIYDAIEEVKDAMEGMLAPEVKEVVTSTIEVREVFHITKVGTVAGAMVKEGKVKRSDKAHVIRDGIVIYTGAINALKRFKDDVKEVSVNFECGISLVNYNDLKAGDTLETYEEVEVKKSL